MNRSEDLFAVTAVVLLASGLLFPRLSLFSATSLSVYSRSVSYALPINAALFGIGTLFAIFAFAYALWLISFSRSVALWHFWLSASAVLLIAAGFGTLGSPSTTAPGAVKTTAIALGILGGSLLFIVGQAIFVVN